MAISLGLILRAFLTFYISLSIFVRDSTAQDDTTKTNKRKAYSKGDIVPVTCLNRTIETGEHITDSHGNLQYIPFLHCNETNNSPLSFTYGIPTTQTCTIDLLTDEFYHLIEYFVHSDVPLSCRVPSYPLTSDSDTLSTSTDATSLTASDSEKWTPLTIALQGTLQLSHLHLHTNINVLFHTYTAASDISSATRKQKSALLSHEIPNS